MYKGICEPGYLLFKWPHHLSSKGRSNRERGRLWADWFWICLVVWYMGNKVLLTAEMKSGRAGWNADGELTYSYRVTPLLLNSSFGNSCCFPQVCSISQLSPAFWMQVVKALTIANKLPYLHLQFFLLPFPLSSWCELVLLEQISLHFNYTGSFCPRLGKLGSRGNVNWKCLPSC